MVDFRFSKAGCGEAWCTKRGVRHCTDDCLDFKLCRRQNTPPTPHPVAQFFAAISSLNWQVRLVSVAHDSEVTLPLLSVQPPPAEPAISVVDDQSPDNLIAAEGEDAGARPSSASASKARPPSADAPRKRPGSAKTHKEKKSSGQATLASAVVPADGGETAGCESVVGTETGNGAWEEREVPASAGSFFFVVPPLPTPAPRQASDITHPVVPLLSTQPPATESSSFSSTSLLGRSGAQGQREVFVSWCCRHLFLVCSELHQSVLPPNPHVRTDRAESHHVEYPRYLPPPHLWRTSGANEIIYIDASIIICKHIAL